MSHTKEQKHSKEEGEVPDEGHPSSSEPRRCNSGDPTLLERKRAVETTKFRCPFRKDGRCPAVFVLNKIRHRMITNNANGKPQIEMQNHLGNYILDRKIGDGGQGEVYLGWEEKTKKAVAIKTYRIKNGKEEEEKKKRKRSKSNSRETMNDSELQCEIAKAVLCKFEREIAVLNTLKENKHVVGLEDVIRSKKGVPKAMVLEYADLGDLDGYVTKKGKLSLTEAFDIFKQLLRGITFAHSHSIVHRDLKPGNILMYSGGVAKICDWGYAAQWTSHKKIESSVGTANYIAHEVLFNKKYSGPEVDIWGLGAVLYFMLTGRAPFSTSTGSVATQIKKGKWWSKWSHVSFLPTPVLCLLDEMMTIDPMKRPTVYHIRKRANEILSAEQNHQLTPSSATELKAVRPELAKRMIKRTKKKVRTKHSALKVIQE